MRPFSVSAVIDRGRAEDYYRMHPEQIPVLPPESVLTNLQKVALLKMLPSTLARGIASRLQEQSQDKPCWRDYVRLRELGFAEKPATAQWHELTHLGRAEANALARREAKRLGVHLLQDGHLRPGGMANWRCSGCGWSAYERYSSNGERRAMASFGRHLEEIDAHKREPESATEPQVEAPGIAAEGT